MHSSQSSEQARDSAAVGGEPSHELGPGKAVAGWVHRGSPAGASGPGQRAGASSPVCCQSSSRPKA